MKNYSLLIWDFNGTLLNDVGAALASVNDMLARRGKKPIDIDAYRQYIDVPIIRFYEQVFELEHENYQEILAEYQAGYESHLKKCRLTDFVQLALDTAKNKGIPQVVLSSSEQNQLERLLRKYDIADYFDAVLGSQDFFAGSKVERAKLYIEENKIESSCVLVIGDLTHDFEVAQAIGSQCLLLTSGHHDRERLERTVARVEDTLESFVME